MREMREIGLREDPRPADLQAVRSIVESAGLFRDEETEIAVELVAETLSRGEASGYRFVFAEEALGPGDPAAAVLGYCCYGRIPCTLTSYDLYWIAVRPEEQGRGLGTRLLERCEERIAESGGTRIYAETSSRDAYEDTRLFYWRRGYAEETVLEDFYAPGDSKVIFLKTLS